MTFRNTSILLEGIAIGGVPLPRRFEAPRVFSHVEVEEEKRNGAPRLHRARGDARKENRVPRDTKEATRRLYLIGRIMGGDDWLRVPNKGEVNTNATTNNATNECNRTVRSSLRFWVPENSIWPRFCACR